MRANVRDLSGAGRCHRLGDGRTARELLTLLAIAWESVDGAHLGPLSRWLAGAVVRCDHYALGRRASMVTSATRSTSSMEAPAAMQRNRASSDIS
jgi:hypothetical protein